MDLKIISLHKLICKKYTGSDWANVVKSISIAENVKLLLRTQSMTW